MRVLVVEDEPDLLDSLLQAFREEGLFKAVNNPYDAIVLGHMLPKLSGRDILSVLRPSSKTPVLMLTARDAIQDRVDALDSGADDYLVKPFDLAELLARLRALIRRSATLAHPSITVQDVQIDLAARTVTQAGQPVELTAREYSLVEYLALHAGKVISRPVLYEHLFDENDTTLSNLLDVHVSNVRRKLGHKFISTRRGHGYTIEPEAE